MDKIRELSNRPLVVAAAAFVVGIMIGWFVIGWGIWPVQWTGASAAQLSADRQEDFLRMAIDSYANNPDPTLAKMRLNDLGKNASGLLDKVKKNNGKQDAAAVGAFDKLMSGAVVPPAATKVAATPASTEMAEATKPASEATAAPTTEDQSAKPGTKTNLTVVLVLMCLLTLVIAAILAYLFIFRNRQPANGSPEKTSAARSVRPVQQSAPGVAAEGEQEPPIVQYLTTYTLGNDLYDDSFSIDSPSGEFLGECGVGISETIGVGDPKKVTAFEVWLFDKNDIQTVTKVVMSEYAFKDPTIMQRLASKGEPVLSDPGKRITLETATLRLEARVVTMNYGQGALPQSSFFDQMTLELAVWPKQPAA